jgi:hypothetical protein
MLQDVSRTFQWIQNTFMVEGCVEDWDGAWNILQWMTIVICFSTNIIASYKNRRNTTI